LTAEAFSGWAWHTVGDMHELLISLLGLAAVAFVGGVLWVVSENFTKDPGVGFIGWGAVLFVDCIAGVYFLVRFVHWAWAQPIP
jgi:hypothetical protein